MLPRRISSRGYHARFAKRLPHMQRGLLDAKARRHLSTEYTLSQNGAGVPAIPVSPEGVVSLQTVLLVFWLQDDASRGSHTHISFHLFRQLSSVWESNHCPGKNLGPTQALPRCPLGPQGSAVVGFAGVGLEPLRGTEGTTVSTANSPHI